MLCQVIKRIGFVFHRSENQENMVNAAKRQEEE